MTVPEILIIFIGYRPQISTPHCATWSSGLDRFLNGQNRSEKRARSASRTELAQRRQGGMVHRIPKPSYLRPGLTRKS
jgi:hypothetical protein